MAEMRAAQMKSKFGHVGEISAVDYVQEVNKAGDGVWVVLHLYQQGWVDALLLQIDVYSCSVRSFILPFCNIPLRFKPPVVWNG